MGSPAAAGRMALWSIELSKFDIQYHPCTTIKGQVVADFIAEFTSMEGKEERSPQWIVFTDGSSNKKAGGVGVMLKSPEGEELKFMIRLNFLTTNNEVEYEALLAGLDLAQVVEAVNGEYECKGEKMKKYWEQTKKRIDGLQAKIVQIPRGENEHADRLSKAASAESMITIDGEIGSENSWTTPLISYLKDGTLPNEKEAARKLKVRSARFSNIIRQPAEELTPITAPWSFAQWGLDIMGPFPMAARQLKFLVIGIDYFTKWVEAEALAIITEKNIRGFVWKNIVCRTIVRTPTGETHFQLTYGSEAVIPAEIGLTSYRVDNYDEGRNDQELRLQLDLVDEVRAAAEQRLAQYQDLVAKHYNSRVKHRDFKVRDLVLRKVMGAARDPAQGKLGPNWEGPYKIMSWLRKGTYQLETLDEQKLRHPWNAEHLRRYYQ
ncbi:uncharacterized protein LOC142616379 [Castanea sativa]|uniref:uncharacterized protein LOC142616379 n=1 Tax=Castanea sativa TaxID=21020 RepID=UPI003F64A555